MTKNKTVKLKEISIRKSGLFLSLAAVIFLSCVGVSRADYMTSEQCTAQGGSCNWISNYCSDDQESVGLCQGGTFSQGACCRPKLTDTSGADPDPIGAGLGAGGVLPDPNAGLGGPMGGTVTPGTSGIPTTSAPTSGSTGSSGGAGGLVPCDTKCTLCHLVIGFKNIYEFFLKLLFVATMLAITVSGVFYMVSSGSKTLTEIAKKAITYSLTAFVVGMGAWIIINTIMIGLGFKHPYGGQWWQFTCDTTKASPAGSGTGGGGTSTPNWGGGKQNTGTGDGECGGTKSNVEDKANCAKTSKQLDDVLSCIQGKVAFHYEKKYSNPFVDTAFAAGKLSIGLGVDTTGHVTNSCHYGGRGCRGQGNAADLTGSDPEAIQNAAIECGADSVIHNGMAYYGGNSKPYTGSDPHKHVHVSVNNCACGCDYLRC